MAQRHFQKQHSPDLSCRPRFVGTQLHEVMFPKNSYYRNLQIANLDYMMSLDPERLLFHYRLLAGLDTKGAEGYGGWISTASGGAGQFEAHYVTALAKASQTMPDYRWRGESVSDRLSYLVNEMRKCQETFATAHPDNAGYLGAIGTAVFDALEVEGQGQNSTASDGSFVWVPWYFYHKTLESLLDVSLYAFDREIRAIAFGILKKATDWVCRRISTHSKRVRANVLKTEYGGMAEVLYQIYTCTHNDNYVMAAKYFEETDFFEKIYRGEDVLTGLHANTTIPKFLGCAAAYEVTGEEFYKTVCERAFEMLMTRTYANGSVSRGEFLQEPYSLEVSSDTSETCCSYNMIKLADYLFRWSGDKKYADYFENVYTNHILASMAPDSGLKTYYTNTSFGRYKIYHSPQNSFWCCACTGMESFAKLPYGIYYRSVNCVRVNLFYPSEYRYSEDIAIIQSGDFYLNQKTVITLKGSGKLRLSLRFPDWAREAGIKINGESVFPSLIDGYYEIERSWENGDTVEYSLPFPFLLDPLKGHTEHHAIKYGPLLLVADFGTDDISDVQDSQLAFGTAYRGKYTDRIGLKGGTLQENAKIVFTENGIKVLLSTLNQGEIIFRPFNRLFHSRYGMYFRISEE